MYIHAYVRADTNRKASANKQYINARDALGEMAKEHRETPREQRAIERRITAFACVKGNFRRWRTDGVLVAAHRKTES